MNALDARLHRALGHPESLRRPASRLFWGAGNRYVEIQTTVFGACRKPKMGFRNDKWASVAKLWTKPLTEKLKMQEAAPDRAADGGFQVRGLDLKALERLRSAISDHGGVQNVADATGIPSTTLRNALNGKSEPRASLLIAVAKATGRSLDWIVGTSDDAQAGASSTASQHVAEPSAQADVLLVPYYNVRASAGPGALPLHEEPSETFALDRRFARTLGIMSTNVAALTVHGDSAQPNLFEGDTILVDRAYLELRDGGLYVIGVDEDIIVKRIHRQADRSIVLKSDNPAYEPQHVSAADVERLRVIGRVRWAVRGL